MWKERSSIQTNFLRNMIVIVLTSIGLWSLIWIQGEYSAFRAEAEFLHKDHVAHQKRILKSEVDNLVKYIERARENSEQALKLRIKERVTLADQIASNIYRQNIAVKSPGEIGRMIKDALRFVRFDNARCSYFIASMDGTKRMSPLLPELEGTNLIDLQDLKGNYVIRDEINVIKEAGEGFVRSYWAKPGEEPEIRSPKITFVKYFKPLGWYLGTGVSLDDFEEDVQNEVLRHIAELRFGTEGYFFGITSEGNSLLSNGEITRNGGNILERTDPNGIKVIQEQLKAAKKPDGGFVNYSWKKPDTSVPYPKISFVKGIPEWKWSLGAGAYLDTIEMIISAKKAALNDGLRKRVFRSVLALVLLLCLTYLWSKRISGQVQETIETFLIFLKRANSDSISINPDVLPLKEFRAIAISTNNMLQERKQAEKALAESEETYRNLFQNAQVGLFRNRIQDGKILESNEQLARMFGYANRDDFIAEYVTLQNYVFPGTQERILADIKAKGKLENIEVQFYHKNRSVFWVRFSARIFREKGWIEGVAEDITDQKLTEEALRKSEYQYKLLADNATDNIWILQLSDMRMLYTSPSAERLVDYTPEELMKMTLSEYIALDSMENILAVISEELAREGDEDVDLNRSVVLQMQLIKKDKSKIWVEVTATFLRDEAGHVDRVLGITRDISERRRAEEEKIQAQKIAAQHEKMALVGQIAGKMAHDFNNILGVIMGNTEISLLDCQDDEIRKTLKLIFEQTIRGKNLTKNLVVFAKDQEPRQEFFMIREKIDLVVDLLKKDLEGIELIREDGPAMPEVLADPGMVEHALVNLLQNSIHALSLVASPQITIRTYCRNNNIYLEIEDNGCGIPEEYLENVYAPSFTLKGNKDVTGSYKSGIKGTGYGLANVEKYIKQHKGDVLVETEFGSGTKFIISLPVIKKELTNDEKEEIRKSNLHCAKRILLVEDETSISDVQYRILTEEPFNHKVDLANNGQSAIDLFDGNDYDFVSLDYILLGNINGMDIYNHIRKNDKAVPVLFISGNIEFLESIKELRQKDPHTDHLSKPCQNKDYVNSVNRLLDRVLSSCPASKQL